MKNSQVYYNRNLTSLDVAIFKIKTVTLRLSVEGGNIQLSKYKQQTFDFHFPSRNENCLVNSLTHKKCAKKLFIHDNAMQQNVLKL